MPDGKSPLGRQGDKRKSARGFFVPVSSCGQEQFLFAEEIAEILLFTSGYDIVVVEKEYTDHFWKDKTEENKGETYGTEEDNSIDF